ncbi:MAG TPA: cytochrome c oxidase subunit II [Propionibacteriaceae bacterium]|nr:cytochrome c oxidase subunit II [Propionibacteriaceae bacterium]
MGGSSERPALNGQSPEPVRPWVGLARRLGLVAVVIALFTLAGCSVEVAGEVRRLGLPEPATNEAPTIYDLWIGTWIAAGAIGVGTWGLILYAAVRFKTRHNDMPKQNRYNLPMEVFYTIAPFVVVGVLFYYTILAQNRVTENDASGDVTVNVVAQKWSWTFNYKEADNPAVGADVYEAGTINKTPTLYLPVNKSVRFVLNSPDVIHSFWVPSFYRKLDVIPGRNNTMVMTPTQEGTFRGKCTELCGTYHSAMLFNVAVVSEDEYNAYLKGLVARGQVGEAKGPADANSPARVSEQPGPQEDDDRAGEGR